MFDRSYLNLRQLNTFERTNFRFYVKIILLAVVSSLMDGGIMFEENDIRARHIKTTYGRHGYSVYHVCARAFQTF